MNKYPLSFSKTAIGNIKLKNRIVSSAVSINMANEDGTISEHIISYFSNLAKNNVGLVIVGAAAVTEEGKVTKNEIHIGERSFDGLKKLSDSIKSYDSASCLQVGHVGAQGNPKISNKRIVGPSKYISPDIGVECEVLTKEEIIEIEDKFVEGILIAEKAGFDFIEIHLAHGYLLHEFLSDHTNHRADEYGGSQKNKLRIIKNIFDKLKNKIDFKKIGARISGNDFLPNGLNIEKNKPLVNLLDGYGISYYFVTAGIYETAAHKYTTMKVGDYWNYAFQLKSLTKTPVIAQGNITSVAIGEKILQQQKGDLFGMCQALIADPELITKTINSKEENVFKCLAHIKVGSCHRCRYLKQKSFTYTCVTPSAWQSSKKIYTREKDLLFWKETIKKLESLDLKKN